MGNPLNRRIKRLRRRQLDEAFGSLCGLAKLATPPKGWIAEIRQALGMSASQLAARLGMARPSLDDIEKAEAQRSVSLKTLDKVAAALGCRVVYALVPKESLESIVQERARAVATKIVDRISHTMALEDQKVAANERERQIQEIAEDLARNMPRQLWAKD